jgi:hypothetical protein
MGPAAFALQDRDAEKRVARRSPISCSEEVPMSEGTTPEVNVSVVGAGMAGLTAALYLARRGYKVTVFEEKPYIGGKFGAHTHWQHGDPPEYRIYYEHCYHFFLNWYHNFWKLTEDIGCPQASCFEPRTTLKCLRKGQHPQDMTSLTNIASPTHIWENLSSRTESIPDMFLYFYSTIDLLAAPLDQQKFLQLDSVNGFLNSRPYITAAAAQLHQYNLAKAFASPSYLSAAATYKNFVKYSVRAPDPMLWVLKGNSYDYFFKRFEDELTKLNCSINKNLRLKSINQKEGETLLHFSRLEWNLYKTKNYHAPPSTIPRQDGKFSHGEDTYHKADYVILAVPPKALSDLVDVSDYIRGNRPQSLEDVRKLRSQPMVSIDLYFNKKIENIPKEHVVLLESLYEINFIDNSQLWESAEKNKTFLNIVASDYPIIDDINDQKYAWDDILAELKKYIPFEYEDIDREKSHIQTNIGEELFVNEVGSWQWRPEAQTNVPNIFIAGDFCKSFIDVVTVEGAVVSGLLAAKALQARVQQDRRLDSEDRLLESIEIIEPESYSELSMLALSLLWSPYAYLAKWWSWAAEPRSSPPSFSELAFTAIDMLWAPYVHAAQWWQAAREVSKNVLASMKNR